MIDTKVITIDGKELCKTYSTIGNKIKQKETGVIYSKECIDIIDHYDNEKPKSKWTYQETSEKDNSAEILQTIKGKLKITTKN